MREGKGRTKGEDPLNILSALTPMRSDTDDLGPSSVVWRLSSLGDSLSYHHGHNFSTYDRDNDKWSKCSCARQHRGAWWYSSCSDSNLNGQYKQGGKIQPQVAGLEWKSWMGYEYSLKFTEMKLRPQYNS